MLFDWVVKRGRDWPPQAKPNRPVGVTVLEIARSCGLRALFEASPGYERRLSFSARIGSAFHRTLEMLAQQVTPLDQSSQLAPAHEIFASQLAKQIATADLRPRERNLPRDPARIQAVLEAVVSEAHRMQKLRTTPVAAMPRVGIGPTEARSTGGQEIPVQSRDGLIGGRIDLVEITRGTLVLTDYKSAMRPDVPDRYQRQIRLYAALWHEQTGQWPTGGRVVYPLIDTEHDVPLDPSECESLLKEARELAMRIDSERTPGRLATPGEVCKVCDFRPWCEPFWSWVAASQNPREVMNNASLGLEGVVTHADSAGGALRIRLSWRGLPVSLSADLSRFPHVAELQPGSHLRVLDWRLGGMRHAPTATATSYSELFVVE